MNALTFFWTAHAQTKLALAPGLIFERFFLKKARESPTLISVRILATSLIWNPAEKHRALQLQQ